MGGLSGSMDLASRLVRASQADEYARTVRTVIVAGLLTQGVREALNEAVAALNASGGNL